MLIAGKAIVASSSRASESGRCSKNSAKPFFSPPVQTGPTVWMTNFDSSLNPVLLYLFRNRLGLCMQRVVPGQQL